MEDVQAAIEALQRARETKLAELDAIDRALAALGAPVSGSVERQVGRDFEHLGIVEATKRYLSEKGEPRTTREIAEALLARGVQTKSKKYVATVYATLDNAKKDFRRKDGKWELVVE
jgi:hypothetical protein